MLRTLLTTFVAATFAAGLTSQAPCFDLPAGTDLNLGDDTTSSALNLGFTFTYGGVAYTQVRVCSNGYVWLGAANAVADWNPTEAELLAQGPRICGAWMDFNPTIVGSGHVYFDNSTPGFARVTWAGVYTFGTTIKTDMQITLDLTNSVTVTIGQLGPSSTAQGGTTIIGATTGGGAVANNIVLTPRPIISASDTTYQVILNPTGTVAPYANTKMQWTPTSPGFVITDVACTAIPLPLPGSAAVVGAGCPTATSVSVYETFTVPASIDLAGLDKSFVPNGCGGYFVVPGISPTFFTGAANNLLLIDDSTSNVALPFAFPHGGGTVSNVWVSSNGFITLDGTDPGSGCCAGDPVALLAGSPRIAGMWEDLNPAAGGAVFADLDTVTGEFCITWNAVREFGQTNTETFQIALSPSGQFTIRWVALAFAGGTQLTGYSSGGGATNPGSSDVSALNGVNLGCRTIPLSLDFASGTRPTIGLSFSSTASGIQSLPNGVFCILLISTEIPGGVPLDGFGLTGCTAYVALPEIASFFNLTIGAPSTTFTIGIPNDNAFLGLSLMTQAISDDLTANAFGYRVSNGLRWNIGGL